jgi:acetyl-CoA carboxylase biotin carboxyl carrier protein
MMQNGAHGRENEPESDKATATEAVPAAAAGPDTGIDAVLVGQLARLLGEGDLSELEIEKGDLRIRIVRYPAGHGAVAGAPAPVAATAPPLHQVAVPAAAAAPPVPDADHPGAVKSPMVGTAYRRASPDSKAFVEIGQVVKAGEKVLLVEAMKTFNEIVAPRAGTVVALFVDDGQPVEYGEPLMIID